MLRRTLPVAVLALALPTAAADDKPVEPFDGTLMGWQIKAPKKPNWQPRGLPAVDPNKPEQFRVTERKDSDTPVLWSPVSGSDIYTDKTFGDCTLELEFMVPKGSNSGIYLMGEYEVQILDSYGKPDAELKQSDLGALYSAAAPKKNAAKKPGEWQKFVIEFQAPRFEGDKKVANAKFVKVTLNDVVLHEDVEMKGPTPGGLTGKEAATGPLMFQGDHGPIAFRNIKITPRAK